MNKLRVINEGLAVCQKWGETARTAVAAQWRPLRSRRLTVKPVEIGNQHTNSSPALSAPQTKTITVSGGLRSEFILQVAEYSRKLELDS